MIKKLLYIFFKIIESYLFIVFVAIALGIFYPSQLAIFSPFTTLMLQIIFFLSSLKLETAELFRTGKEWRMLLKVNMVILIVLPIIVYLIASIVTPTMVFALVLLSTMPAGMSLPLMVDVIGGNKSLALLITISSSLLAPITVPIMLTVLTSTSVQLPFLPMVWRLFLVIIVPFVLAQIVQRVSHVKIHKLSFSFKSISLVLLGLLIASSIAVNAGAINVALNDLSSSLIILFLFFIGVHLFTHFVFFRKSYKEQVTIASSVTFMNFTLAIYLASLYVPDPRVLLILVISIIPWALLLIPFKYVTDFMKSRDWIS